MKKLSDLKQILTNAARNSNQPDRDLAWMDMLNKLDLELPQKKKRPVFFFILPFVFASIMGIGIWKMVQNSKRIKVLERETMSLTNAQNAHKSTQSASPGQESTSPLPGIQDHDYSTSLSIRGKMDVHDKITHFKSIDLTNSKHKEERNTPKSQYELFLEDISTKLVFASPVKPMLEPLDINDLDRSRYNHLPDLHLSVKDRRPPRLRGKRNFSVGGKIYYSFNNSTKNEDRGYRLIPHTVFQFTKQVGLGLYGRMPLSPTLQIHAEMGLEKQSSQFQINYIRPNSKQVLRYQLNSLTYSSLRLNTCWELKRDLYLLLGGYAASS